MSEVLTLTQRALLDEACDRFESAWNNGEEGSIEAFLTAIEPAVRPVLLKELVLLEAELRQRNQERPSRNDYLRRFPDDRQLIEEVWLEFDNALATHSHKPIGQADCTKDACARPSPASSSGRLEVRCPTCHEPTNVCADTELTDLTCSSCGTHFSLVDQGHATQLAAPLSIVGRFELIERIGVGGFGSVWKARDKELDRTVAIKIPRQGAMSTDEQEIFFREARAAAQLRHPGIVNVHEVGRDGNSVFIVSDFVRGITLGDWLTAYQPTNRESAELCAEIADALDHAHHHGVVHRDLKPANIIIDDNGHPHLMDFGLARRDVGDVTIAVDGKFLGTPAYASPEQAQGDAHTADRRSDIYSLGVIVYQLLTGSLPFRGNVQMLLYQAVHDEPPSLRKLNGNVPRDLETITLKCLEKEPEKRYATARQLSDDLRRFLRSEPILARPVPVWERAVKWVRRHPALSTLIAVVCIAISSGFLGLLWHHHSLGLRQRELQEQAQNLQDFSKILVGAFESTDPIHFGGYRFGNALATRDYESREILDDGRDFVIARKSQLQPALRANLLNSLGSAYSGLGKLGEARKCLNDALTIQSELGDSIPSEEFATTLHNVGFLDFLCGRFGEAEDSLRKSLAIKTRLHAANQIDLRSVVATQVVLAATLLETQRGPEIKKLLEEVVASSPDKPEVRDRDFAVAALGLALVYARLGESSEASQQILKAQRILIESHDEMAGVLDSAAHSVIFSASGNDRAATQAQSNALLKAKEILGAAHPIVHVLQMDLAESNQRMGNPQEAKEQLKQELAQAIKLFGQEPRTAEVLYHLGDIELDLQQRREAIKFYKEADEVLNACGQADQYDGAEISFRLGMMELIEGHISEARQRFQQVIDFGNKFSSEQQHPVIAYGYFGMALAELSNHDMMRMQLDTGVNKLHQTQGDVPAFVAQLASLGDTFYEAGLKTQGKVLYEQALRIQQGSDEQQARGMKQLLPQSWLTVESYSVGRACRGLGQFWLEDGDKIRARTYLERAVTIFAKQLGNDDPRTFEIKELVVESHGGSAPL